MKTTLFVIAAFLFSGVVSAQKASVKTTQSATVGTSSVNGAVSTQAASQTDIKSANVNANNATNATVKSTQHTTTAINHDAKQTVVGTKAAVKSVDATAGTKTRIAAASSVKAAGAVHKNLKTPSIRTTNSLRTNMKVGLR